MSESYNKMMDAINKSQAFVIKYVWVAIILLILFVTWYYRKQLNKKEDNNTAMEIIYNKPDFFPKISSIQKNDAQFPR
jgi:Fe2+ transport system protein B